MVIPNSVFYMLTSGLQLLRQDRSLAPANDLHRWKAILVNHAEVLFRLAEYFLARVLLETKQNLEKGGSR